MVPGALSPPVQFPKITLIGVGLLGGSVGLAARERGVEVHVDDGAAGERAVRLLPAGWRLAAEQRQRNLHLGLLRRPVPAGGGAGAPPGLGLASQV